jgi:type III secretion protein V
MAAGARPSNPTVKRLLSGADAGLAGVVLTVVVLMIVPLPTWLLDILLAANLASAVTVLLTLYVSEALQIASYPSLLLVTTLVRLGLNVASTRLILLQADAGHVIHAFGNFVVRGNYIVGAVIFLILTIIQFVVIAKGAERVAEVGARFALDAMPGKQMAIDAELRSGAIDVREANRRRRQLARESQFYGAMDGAMKFVKGDVIASFIIAIINILAGLAIGIGSRGLDAVGALKVYGLLTIGDGLVSQLPALLLATSAGILVTRVASDEPDVALGQELAGQFLGVPRAFKVAAGFVTLLGLVPGLPLVPFLLVGGALLWLGSVLGRPAPDDGTATAPTPADTHRLEPVVVPWTLRVSKDLEPYVEDVLRGGRLTRSGIRSVSGACIQLVFRDLGVPLPPARLEPAVELPSRTVQLLIHEVPAAHWVLSTATTDAEFAPVLLAHCLPLMHQRAADFLGLGETQSLLDRLEQHCPALVRQVIPKPVTLPVLSEVLRRLVEEGVSIRDLRGVLEALAQFGQLEREPMALAEFVRSQRRRALTYQLTGGRNELPVLLLSPDIEEVVRGSVTRTPAGSFLTLAPATGRDIVARARLALESLPKEVMPIPVLLTQPDVRRFVRKLLESDLPQLKVISYAELQPEIALRPLGQVSPP